MHNVVVLPNSALAKLNLTNLTRPDESHLVVVANRIAADRQPSAIEGILKSALEDCPCIVHEPKPIVAFKGIDAIAIDVELQFRVTSPANRTPARNEIIDVVSTHCAAHGLLFAMPAHTYLFVSNHGDNGKETNSILALPGAL